MKINHFLAIPALLAGIGLSGCVDSDYDLSDIDTTAQFKVNDLTIPVNLNDILLSDIIKVNNNPGDIIQEIDGEYVVIRDGDFKSDPIKVEETTVRTEAVEPIVTTVYKYEGSGYLPPNFTIPAQTYSYEVTPCFSTFHSETDNIPTNIRSIESAQTTWTMSVEIKLQGNTSMFSQMAFHNLVIVLPAGLQGPEIAFDGTIQVSDFVLSGSKTTHTLDVDINNIDFDKFKASPENKFEFTPGPIGSKGHIMIEGRVGLKSGEIIVETKSSTTQAPGSATMITAPSFSPIQVKTITGDFYYSLDTFNVSDVDISGLPDFLAGDETDLALTNPQIYISINNPLASYGLKPTSGLSITASRPSGNSAPAMLNPGQVITVGANKGIAGPYMFCLSPETPDPMYAPFAGAQHVGYAALSDVFSGQGIPDKLKVDFVDASVKGHVNKFVIGQELQTVTGKYTFYSPLNLVPGSKIVYSDTEDGWSDDTVEKLTITRLKLSTTVVNSLPLDAEITGYPISTDRGKQCVDPTTGKPVTITPVKVKANSTEAIVLVTDGTVVDLDGIVFRATVISAEAQNLKPSGTLKLTKIRATADGYYTDKL